MNKIKRNKKFVILGVLLFVLVISSIFVLGRFDKYKGLIKIKSSNIKLLSDVSLTSSNIKGNEELTYQVKFTLDEIDGVDKRDVVITGELNSSYARFKPISSDSITSEISNGGKNITVNISDVPLGEEQIINLKINVVNAPNNEKIIPIIKIKELTGEFKILETESLIVQTNSISGSVLDENDFKVSNIELSLNKDGNEIKRTYVNNDGNFVFSDLEEGIYTIKVEEDNYELTSDSTSSENNELLLLKVKHCDKFNIETHKYVNNLKLIVDGKENNYSYEDAETVVQNIKKFDNISGEIEYKIVVKNNSDRDTEIREVIDELQEGLSFDKEKNPGWELVDGYIKYLPAEGVSLSPYEKREYKIKLDIINTKELKTYINIVDTKGDIRERVAFILDGNEIRNISVLEGEKITKPDVGIDVTWYTDRNRTNEYNFDNPVNKNLILYAFTGGDIIQKYNVRFIDDGIEKLVEVVNENEKVNKPEDPSKEGYTFKCWTLNDTCYDFDNIVAHDIDLVSEYEVITYDITYDLDGGNVSEENPDKYTVEDEFTLNEPHKEGYTFIGWTGTNLEEPTLNLKISKGSIGDRTYTANYEIKKSTLTVRPNGGIYNNSLSSTVYEENYGTIMHIDPSEKRGYTFRTYAKTGGGTFVNNTYTFDEEDGVLVALYDIDTFTITYAGLTEEELATLNNPVEYNVETETFTLNNPTSRLDGNNYPIEDFLGWDDGNGNVSTNVTISKGTLNNKAYTAVWSNNDDSYSITYNLNDGELEQGKTNPNSYKRKTETFTLNNPIKRGYTFSGWTGTGLSELTTSVTIEKGSSGSRNYTANYSLDNYSISYEGLTEEETTSLNNPTGFTVETETFTLNNPTSRLDGNNYPIEDFLGWDDGSGNISTNVTITKGNIDNRTYTAVWKENDDPYSITYNLNDGELEQGKTNPSSYKRKTETFTLNNPIKRGYTFTGWTGTGLSELTTTVTVTKGSSGSKNYVANYSLDNYSISYAGLTEGEITSLNNPTGFTVETETFTLNNPTSRLDGNNEILEEFLGWDDGSGNISTNVTITKGNIDNRTYTAVWKENDDSYSITYNLNDGELEQGKTNPNSYKRKTETFTLNNPIKRGYTFSGWTGTGLSGLSTNVTITKGSSGKRNYTANYSLDNYTITYEGLTNEEITILNNPASYNVETESFTLNNPSKEGYTFTGWSGTGISGLSTNVTITKGSIDNRTYTANFEIKNSTLTINPNGGTYLGSASSVSFTEDYGTIKQIENSEKTGYEFINYVHAGGGYFVNNIYTFNDVNGELTATYEIIPYTITYEGLTNEEKTTLNNPASYNVETESFTLNNPTSRLDGNNEILEDFLGWDDGSGNLSTEITITQGTTGNKTYTAVWKENDDSYSITYNLNDGELEQGKTNPNSYKRKTETFTLNNPSKEGYTFTGWTGTGLSEPTTTVTIEKGSSGKRNYTANYSLDNYSITYEGLTNEEKTTLNNPVSYNVETEDFLLNNPTSRLDGNNQVLEEFVGWDDGSGVTTKTMLISKGSTGNKTFTAVWETPTPVEEFNITYNLNEGELEQGKSNPSKYSVNTETFTLNNPSKEGYTFTGWSGTGIDGLSTEVTIEKGSTGDRAYEAHYELSPFTITYNGLTETELQTANNPVEYTAETETFTLTNPIREGYEFIGWSGTGIDSKNYTVTFDYQDGRSNTYGTYSEIYSPNGWKVNGVHYDDNEVITLKNDTVITRDYIYNEQKITLPEPTRENYVFLNWNSKSDGTGTVYNNTNINNLEGSTKVYAIWRKEKITITFDSQGGEEVEPVEINYNSSLGTLPRPTKEDKVLEGWYRDSDCTQKIASFTIFTEDTKLYAKWIDNTFPYVYGPYTDSFVCTGSNYINTGIKLYDDTNYLKDYEIGFTVESYVGSEQVKQAVLLNTKYEKSSLKWPGLVFRRENESNNFELTQSINNGTKVSVSLTNITLPYKVQIFRIKNKIYYSINDSEMELLQDMTGFNQQFDVATYFCAGDNGSGGIQRYAKATISNYYIKKGIYDSSDIDLDDGVEPNSGDTQNNSGEQNNEDPNSENNDPNTQNEENNIIPSTSSNGVNNVITVVDADGVISTHNVGDEYSLGTNDIPGSPKTLTVTIPTGSSGNRIYIANFEINRHRVTYMDGEDKFYEEDVNYNSKAQGTSDIPTRPHKVFKGWTLDNNLFNYETPITSDITLYSSFEDVEEPIITYAPDVWTNTNVVVTISSNHDEYSYMYKIGDGDYQLYDGPFAVNQNTTVYAYSVNAGITSLETTAEITNIDKINPVINQTLFENIAPTHAVLRAKIRDDQSGLDKYKIYLDDTLIYESISYSSDVTEEKQTEYRIDNLESDTTYSVTIEVYDVVGNVASEELTLTTTDGTVSVARTLNYEGIEISRYPTLEDAINSDECTLNCHIEMLENVVESNSIFSGQTIKIDLNGKTISSTTNNAFYNDGILTIVDYNDDADRIGQVLSNFTAIKNTGTLQIGENETELEVSHEEPIIGGNIYGIESTGRLKFFDGIIMGHDAIKGTVDETPYLYNANIFDEADDIQVARLDKVSDAVARIDSIYYSEAQNAVDNAKNGYKIKKDSLLTETLQSNSGDEYTFVYDENANVIKNNNQGHDSTIAHSYIELDLRDYADDQNLTVTAVTDVGYDYGYVLVNESPSTPTSYTGYMISLSGAKSTTVSKTLQSGKKYYIHLIYKKDGNNTNDRSDTFKITKLQLANLDSIEFESAEDVYMYNPTSYYFAKQPDGTYVNNNSNYTSTARSYFAVDLLDANEDKYIEITADLSRGSTSDVAYMYVSSTSALIKSTSLSNMSPMYYKILSDGEEKYILKLSKGEMNYIHFVYDNKYNSTVLGSDTFVIKDIRPIKFDNNSISSTDMVNNGTYYFEKRSDGVYINTNTRARNTVANSYIMYDLTDSPNDLHITISLSTSGYTNSDIAYITLTDNSTAPTYGDMNGRLVYLSGHNDAVYNITIPKGKISYLHFGFSRYGSNTSAEFMIKGIYYDDGLITSKLSSVDMESTVYENFHYYEFNPVLNEDPDTVQLLKNITLSEPLVIDSSRDVIIDLNGKILSTSSGYVIDNRGSLKLIDSEFDSRMNINNDYKASQQELYNAAKQQYLEDLAEYEEYVGLCDGCEPSAEYIFDQALTTTYDYTGHEEEYTVYAPGKYKIEAWGAQGGDAISNSTTIAPGGYGSYSSGEIELNTGDKLYINVGGRGEDSTAGVVKTYNGGYNGGGNGYTSRTTSGTAGSSGGGATSIATTSGLLSTLSNNRDSIIVVAGGGGGSHSDTDGNGYSSAGGHGGGYMGHYAMQIDGTCSSSCTRYNYPSGGTQENGGLGVDSWDSGSTTSTSYVGTFGQGATGTNPYGGGGGGFYGGASGTYNGGGGGSGYIGNSNLTNKKMVMYSTDNSFVSTNESTKTEITTNHSEEPVSDYAKEENGYVKITRSLTAEEIEEMESSIPKRYNIKTKPMFSDYLSGIDFDSSVDINELDVDSPVDFNNKVSDELEGSVYSTTDSTIYNEEGAYLDIDTANVIIDAGYTTYSEPKAGVYNSGQLTIGDNGHIQARVRNSVGIYNAELGDILDGSGKITNSVNGSVGIRNESNIDSNIKGYKITSKDCPYSSTGSSCTNFLHNTSKEVTLEDFIITGEGDSIFVRTGATNFNVKNSILNSTNNNVIYLGSTTGTTYTFDNCNIEGNIDDYYDYSSAIKININNSNISNGTKEEIVNNTFGEFTLNNTNVTSNHASHNVITNSSILNINGGSINGKGITNSAGGTLNIKGNLTMNITGDYYAITNSGALTIGNNEDAISTNYPLIKGETKGILTTSGTSFNFYDGKLVGNINHALEGVISVIPTNYDINVNKSNGKEEITLKPIVSASSDDDYIAAIGNNKFVSLQSAVDFAGASTNPVEITLLKDVYTTVGTTIPSGYNISLNEKNHIIKSYKTGETITNNGTFKITDDSETIDNNNSSYGTLFLNNGTMTYDKVKSTIISSGSVISNSEGATLNIVGGSFIDAPRSVINSGTTNISNAEFKSLNSSGSNNVITNNETGYVKITSGTINCRGGGPVINNYGNFVIDDVIAVVRGWSQGYNDGPGKLIANNTNATFTINGGSYTGANQNGSLISNDGTATISNVANSSVSTAATNTGTLTINNSSFTGGTMSSSAGTLNLNGTTTARSVTISGTSDANINGSTINNSVSNSSSGTMNFEDSTINYSSTALTISGTGTTNIKSGTIKSTNNYGISASGSPTIVLGTQAGEVSKEDPKIIGKAYGLYNPSSTSTVKLYDGVISGTSAIYGSVSETESGYEVVSKTENSVEYKYLDQLPLIVNKRTTHEYNSFSLAFDEAESGDTLELLREYTNLASSPTVTIPVEKAITLDLKGFGINQNNETLLINNGTLSINSTGDGGKITSSSGSIFINNGTLNLEDGEYYMVSSSIAIVNNAGAALNITGADTTLTARSAIDNYSTVTINGGKFLTPSSLNVSNVITNNANCTVTMNNTTFDSRGGGPVINNLGIMTMTNASATLRGWSQGYNSGSGTFIDNKTGGTITLDGGNFSGTSYNGKLIVNAGTALIENITSSLTVGSSNTGTLTINDSTLTSGSLSSSEGSVTIDGSTLSGSLSLSGSVNSTITNSIFNNSVSFSSSGTLDMTNNTLSYSSTALSLSGSGTTNFASGTITSTSSYGVSISGNAIFTIGVTGDGVSKSNPSIKGKTYGLYNSSANSKVYFYDGVIIGQSAIYGTITGFESGYEIISETVDSLENKYLDMLPVVRNSRTTIEYNSIQQAVNIAQDGDTIELIREYTTVPSTPTVTIPQNKSITFDLTQYRINHSNSALFTINGSLSIKSTSGGTISSNGGTIFDNNGTLTIINGTYSQNGGSYIISNSATGTVNIQNGQITKSGNMINNSGDLTINGGIFTASSTTSNFTIINNSTGSIVLNGGEMSNAGSGTTISNGGNLEITDIIVNLRGYSGGGCSACYGGSTIFVKNTSSSSYTKMTGGSYGQTNGRGVLVVYGSGTAEISNITSNLVGITSGPSNESNTGTLTINNSTFNINTSSISDRWAIPGINASGGIVNLNNVNINNSSSSTNSETIYARGYSILNLDGNNTIDSAGAYLIQMYETPTVNVNSGTTKSTTGSLFYLTNGTLNIGSSGGTPSLDNPVIRGKTYAILRSGTNGTVNFYDGIIAGGTSPISGAIDNCEDGYKVQWDTITDPDTLETIIEATLTVIGTNTRVIIVNDTNFQTLQSAVNYAVNNEIDRIDLYDNIELDDDVVKPEGIDVNVHLNGFSINQNGHTIGAGINLISTDNNNDLGASVLGNNKNNKNVVIYQLDDGSPLQTGIIYRLYKLTDSDYRIVNLDENNIGNYDIGNDTEEIYTTDGRIYINNISEGNYKLTGSDGSEINFEVLSDNVSSNIRVNNRVIKNRIVTAVATLILQLQTGNIRIPYIIIILILLSIITSVIIIKKHKRI